MADWTIVYYSESVMQFVDALPVGIRACYARITERMIVHGPNLGMPYTRAMGDGLFEIRAYGREGIARVFYCRAVGRKIVMLHGFVKKTDKTPPKELKIATRRLHEVKNEDA
jgi:phage-related protein